MDGQCAVPRAQARAQQKPPARGSRHALLLGLFMVAALGGGCVHYEYDLIEPNGPPRTVRQTLVVQRPPLTYTFDNLDEHLRLRIGNPTDRGILMEGRGSYLVDPHGESITFASHMIAPHAYVSFLFPPRRPVYRVWRDPGWWGPGWGWGPYYYYDWPGPAYYEVRGPPPPGYFTWPPGTRIRLHFAYEQDDNRTEHEFVILRRQK